jgi:hypothetical protein
MLRQPSFIRMSGNFLANSLRAELAFGQHGSLFS